MKTVLVFFIIVIFLKGIELQTANTSSYSQCPQKITLIRCFNLQPSCSNGKLFINNREIAKVKSTDRVEIISNNLIINGKFINYFPPFEHSRNLSKNFNLSGGHITSRAANCKCPTVIQIGCINVTDSCENNKLYVNGIRIKEVRSTDKVVIMSNNLYVNDKLIRYIPPFGVNEATRDTRARHVEEDDDSDMESHEENKDSDASKKKNKKKKKKGKKDHDSDSDVESDEENKDSDASKNKNKKKKKKKGKKDYDSDVESDKENEDSDASIKKKKKKKKKKKRKMKKEKNYDSDIESDMAGKLKLKLKTEINWN